MVVREVMEVAALKVYGQKRKDGDGHYSVERGRGSRQLDVDRGVTKRNLQNWGGHVELLLQGLRSSGRPHIHCGKPGRSELGDQTTLASIHWSEIYEIQNIEGLSK